MPPRSATDDLSHAGFIWNLRVDGPNDPVLLSLAISGTWSGGLCQSRTRGAVHIPEDGRFYHRVNLVSKSQHRTLYAVLQAGGIFGIAVLVFAPAQCATCNLRDAGDIVRRHEGGRVVATGGRRA